MINAKKKKSASLFFTPFVFVLFMLFLAPTSHAATNWFSGQTGTMNALNGGTSAAWNISSGSISVTNPKVTSVTLNVKKSSGSSPFYVYVKNPQGTIASKLVGSATPSFSEFNGQDPQGTWQIWIETTGTVSTATATMRVNYSY